VTAQGPSTFRLAYPLHGRMETREFHQPRVVIGRNPDCDLVVTAQDVSRVHAAIDCDRDGWVISDLNSRYGTFVNHRRVAVQRLKHGDRIILGGGATVLQFEVVPAAAPRQEEVLFGEPSADDRVRMTIGVEELERRMGRPLRPEKAQAMETLPGAEAEASRGKASPEAAPKEPVLPRAGTSLVALFQQIGQVLLTSDDLDDMLGNVLDVAMSCLPAHRGFVCLCDEKAERAIPKVARSKGLARGESITISQSIAREAIRSKQAMLVENARSDRRFSLAASVLTMAIRAAMCAPLYHAGRVEGLIYVDACGDENPFAAGDLELLAALGMLTAVGIVQARLRGEVNREKAVFARLSRYSSPRVVEQIVASIDTPDGTMLAAQREVSVLFADLSGFTSLAESREPAEAVSILNRVFEDLTRAIFQYDGTLDKFLGDGVLAVFGAPVPQADHAERAVLAALLMQQFLGDSRLTGPNGEPLRMRIGVNSGTALAGDIGSPMRKDYTVVGDVVNVASRLQSSVAEPGQIVIGPATYELCNSTVECEPLPEIRLRGKRQSVRPYLVVRHRADTIA